MTTIIDFRIVCLDMNKDSHKLSKEMLTLKGAASYLNISISTIYRYLNRVENPLPAYKISRKNIRIKKEELDEWLEQIFNTEKQNENEGGENI